MEQVTVTFSRVFDLHRISSTRHTQKHTLFSFAADGLSKFSVRVPGWPTIEVGTTVTVLLWEPGNWQTLIGWVDHASGSVSAPNTPHPYISAFTSTCVGLVWCFALLVSERRAVQIVLGIMVAICFTLSFVQVRRASQRALEQKSLIEIQSELTRMPNPKRDE